MPLRYIYLWGLTGDRDEIESDTFLSLNPLFLNQSSFTRGIAIISLI